MTTKYAHQHLSDNVKLSSNNNYEDLMKVIFAGKAIITIQSHATKAHYTYKIKKAKGDFKDNRVFFVSLLHGPDNTSDYAYLGLINRDTRFFRLTGKSRYTEDSTAVKAFKYMFDKLINNLPMSIDIFHEGCCARCGRRLTTPESIKRGIGPECANKL